MLPKVIPLTPKYGCYYGPKGNRVYPSVAPTERVGMSRILGTDGKSHWVPAIRSKDK